jgi:hypothetical protein
MHTAYLFNKLGDSLQATVPGAVPPHNIELIPYRSPSRFGKDQPENSFSGLWMCRQPEIIELKFDIVIAEIILGMHGIEPDEHLIG